MDEVDFNLFDFVNLSRRGTAERSNGTGVPSGDSSEDPAKEVVGRFLPKYHFRSKEALRCDLRSPDSPKPRTKTI